MRFVLKYYIDSVSVELGVDANLAEEAEVLLKKCIAKMLRSFPVGQLFVELAPFLQQQSQQMGQYQGNIWDSSGILGGSPYVVPDTVTVPNNAPGFTAGGYFTTDGSVHFNMNANNSAPLPSGAGVFSVTVTNSDGTPVYTTGVADLNG